ncbi:hypothetical protein DY000_02032468 [Brassica cretica]|uniref:Bet v I/Major latex protein domain-containing protein n=1 Tax=Brassica cretica TaxID=69181 RepID=A0ABQ7DYQ3_BRACR|nr:hypothetical protein DY000_02032468 [Brassica cretica]
MWSRSKSEAAKRVAPILKKETANTSEMEWFRYTETIHKITMLITGFELNNEQAEELKKNMSRETYKQLSRDSVCQLKALNVRTDESCTVTFIEKSVNKFILKWTLEVGKTIDFDFTNIF